MGLVAIFKLSFFIMSQIIFLSIIHCLFSERHLHQIVLRRSWLSLVGKTAWNERLFTPSAFAGFVLDSHTFLYIWIQVFLEFFFRNPSILRSKHIQTPVCVSGVTKLTFTENEASTLKHFVRHPCPPKSLQSISYRGSKRKKAGPLTVGTLSLTQASRWWGVVAF